MSSGFTKQERDEIWKLASEYITAFQSEGHFVGLHNDSVDFIEVAMWELENALLRAYELGRSKNGH